MKNTWKRTAAFVLAMALVVGAVPTNVGTGGTFDRAAITASAGDTAWAVAWADGEETHELPYSDVPDLSEVTITNGDGEEYEGEYDFGVPTYDGTVGTVEVKALTFDDENNPVLGETLGTLTFTAIQKEVTSLDSTDYRLEGSIDEDGVQLVYDGLAKEPKLTELSVNGVPVNEGEYTVSFVNNTNVSTNPKKPPMIRIAFDSERFTGIAGVGFVIVPANINNFRIAPVSFVADENVHIPVFDSGIEGSTLRFKVLEGWYKEQENEDGTVEYVTAEEGEAGAFLSTKTATEAGNYKALIESTIKANCTGQRLVDWSIADIQYVAKTYDGEAVDNNDFAVTNLVGEYGEGSVSIAYYDKGADVTTASPIAAPVDAGDYRAVVTVTDKNTGEGHIALPTLTKTIDFTIAQKTIIVAPEVTSKSYRAETPESLGGIATNPTGVTGDVIVARDQDTLGSEVPKLFKLKDTIAKDAPIDTKTDIIFDDTVKDKFFNYDLQYEAKEFTVVRKSIADATVTLTDESYTYDGTEKKPTIKVEIKPEVEDSSESAEDIILAEGTDFTIDESSVTSATNAGSYEIVLKGNGNYGGEKTVIWKVLAKDIAEYIKEKSTADTTDAVTVDEITYDGTEKTPTVKVKDLTEAPAGAGDSGTGAGDSGAGAGDSGTGAGDSGAVGTTGDFTVTATPQTNAGADYDFTISGVGNYKGTYDGKWEIKKAKAEFVATGLKVYDGVAAKAEDITVDLSKLPQDFVSTTTTGEGDSAVTTKNVSVVFYTYNGEPVFDEDTGEYIGSIVTDGDGAETLYSGAEALKNCKGSKVENAINAGNYVAEVTVSDANGNYDDAVQLVYFQIAKRQAEIYPESGQSKEYHAEVPQIKFELEEAVEGSKRGVVAADMEKAIDIDGEDVEWVSLLSFTDEMEADTPMGTYEIDIDTFAPELMNYDISCSYPVTFEVTPRSLEGNVVFVLKATKGTFLTDPDKPNTFTFDGSTKQVAIDYAYDKNWTVEANAQNGVQVGGNWYKKLTAEDYTTAGVVKMAYSGNYAAQAEGSGNYAGEITGGNGLDWAIEDAEAVITLNADAANKTYDGEAISESAFVVEATTANYPLSKATVTYSYEKVTGYNDGKPITEVVEGAPVNAGTYLVTATAVRRGYADATATAQFTISPKEVTISVTGAADSITYGDTLPKLGYECSGVLEGEDLGLTGNYQIVKDNTAVTEAIPNAGVYTIEGNFTATNTNYTITPETKAFTILKKDLEDVDGTIETVSELTSAIADYGKTEAPVFTVVYKAQTGTKTLVSDVANPETYDYAVNAPTVLADGNYTIEVVGEGNYTGIREISWKVTETDETKEAARAAIAKYVTVKAPEFVVMSESNRIIKIKAESSVDKTGNPNLEVLKTGTIYYRGADLNGTELTLDTVGTVIDEGTGIAVKDVTKGTTASSVNVSDKYNGIYVRNYAIVGDGTYQAVVYTDTVKTSIEELDAKVQELKEALEKVTVSASATIASGTTVKLSASAERGDFTNSETGVVYYRGANLNGNELTLDNVGTEIDNGMTIKSISKGTTASSVNVGDKYNGIYYRGYITVTDSDGNTHTKYTDVRFAKVVDGELTDAVVD